MRNLAIVLCGGSVVLALSLTASTGEAGWPNNPLINLPVCTAPSGQAVPVIVEDGVGGAIIAWYDGRNGNLDIYAQRVSGKGVALWTTNGVALCTAAGDQDYPAIASDGAGGAIITWQDRRTGTNDVYVQRVSAAGVPMWAANGVPVCTAAGYQSGPVIVADGAGGAVIAWYDKRGASEDIYAQRVSAGGTPQWTANGVALCTASGNQTKPQILADGMGGAFVTWGDSRQYLNGDIYAQRVSGTGVPTWGLNGVQVAGSLVWSRGDPVIASDGSGGAIVAWWDTRNTIDIYMQRLSSAGAALWTANGARVVWGFGTIKNIHIAADGNGGVVMAFENTLTIGSTGKDIYAQRVSASGAPLWSLYGRAICTATRDQEYPKIVPDGRGGAFVTWHDARSGTSDRDIFAQQIDKDGITRWGGDGLGVAVPYDDQLHPTMIHDGRGGVIVTWYDLRSGTNLDIYAQRVEFFGSLGDPAPDISWVKDVPGDQGGRVRIRWSASYRDVLPNLDVRSYGIWRRVNETFATSAIARGAPAARSGEEAAAGTIRVERLAGQAVYWEGVGSIPARAEPFYSFVAETFQDSTAAGNPYTTFMVDAHGSWALGFWTSIADSGYSVDNLAPGIPWPFSGEYVAGATRLTWGANTERDLSHYRLHRGTSIGYVPGPGNLIASPTGTSYDDVGPPGGYYKLAAVDVHGNVSGYNLTAPGTTDAPRPDLPRELHLAPPTPNPATLAATLRFALPRAERVSLALYDVGGRRIRSLLDGPLPPGEHALSWDLRDDRGAEVTSGLYFVRLEAGSLRLIRRLTAVR